MKRIIQIITLASVIGFVTAHAALMAAEFALIILKGF